MFDQVFGLPMHVLVVHAAVVFIPLTAVAAVLFVLLPAWRWALRWPMVGLAVVSAGAGGVAALSGNAFFERIGEPEFVLEHKDHGTLLGYLVLVLLVVVLVAAFALGGPTRLAGGRDRPGAARPAQLVVSVLLVLVAVAVGVQVIRTGDAGARAVWGAQAAPQSSELLDASSLR